MTTIDLLERAHAHLTELRDKSTPGVWRNEYYEFTSGYSKTRLMAPRYVSDLDLDLGTTLGDYIIKGDSDLIVALRRTIDAQLDILSLAIEYGELPKGRGSRFFDRAEYLARAILGEDA